MLPLPLRALLATLPPPTLPLADDITDAGTVARLPALVCTLLHEVTPSGAEATEGALTGASPTPVDLTKRSDGARVT